MAVFLEELTYTPENYSTSNAALTGNKNAKITMLAKLRVETFIELDDDATFNFGTLNGQGNWIFDNDFNNSFEEFNVGDSIDVIDVNANVNGTYTIIEKLDNNTIAVAESFTAPGVDFDSGFIRLVQEPKAITYDFGFVPNFSGAGYLNPITNELQRAILSDTTQIGTSFAAMTKQFSDTANIGGSEQTIECRRVSSDTTNHRYFFEVKHTFIFDPFILPNDVQDYLNNPLHLADDPQKHCARFRAYKDPNDIGIFQQLEVARAGNTAQYNRNFSTRPRQYNISGITGGQLAYNQDTEVEFTISDLPTHVAVNLFIVPDDIAQVDLNNTESFVDLWGFDRVSKAIGTGAVNGVFGKLEDFETTTVGTDLECKITVKDISNFHPKIQQRIANGQDVRYFLSVTCYDNTEPVTDSDFTELTISNGIFNFRFGERFTTDLKFAKHDRNDYNLALASSNPKLKVADEVVALCKTTLDTQNLGNISNINISVSILADNITLETNNFQLIGLNNISQPNSLRVLTSEIRKANLVQALQNGNDIDFLVAVPFFTRYEFWRQIASITSNSTLFDISQQFNGYNNDWARIDNLGLQFKLKYNIEAITDVGTVSQEVIENFEVVDFISNPDWINEKIEIFDSNNNLQELNGIPYINRNGINKVVATFEYVSGTPQNVYGVLRMHLKEQGIASESHSVSSLYDRSNLPNNFWQGGLVQISNVGQIWTLEAEIDGSQVPQNKDWTIVATIEEDCDDFCENIELDFCGFRELRIMGVSDGVPYETPISACNDYNNNFVQNTTFYIVCNDGGGYKAYLDEDGQNVALSGFYILDDDQGIIEDAILMIRVENGVIVEYQNIDAPNPCKFDNPIDATNISCNFCDTFTATWNASEQRYELEIGGDDFYIFLERGVWVIFDVEANVVQFETVDSSIFSDWENVEAPELFSLTTIGCADGETELERVNGCGEVQQQNVIAVTTEKITDSEIELLKRPFEACCKKRVVYADETTTDEFKNDFNGFVFFANLLQSNEEIKLYKEGQEIATLDISSNLGQFTRFDRTNDIVFYFQLAWREVLIAYGEGCYHVEFDNEKSDTFTLKRYLPQRVENSVRFTYLLDTTIGDKRQDLRNDFNGLGIIDQVRFDFADFGYLNFEVEENNTRIVNTGKLDTYDRKYKRKYIFNVGDLPIELLNLFAFRILYATDIIITDYNSVNTSGKYVNINVKPSGNFQPNYDGKTRPLTFEFEDAFDNSRIIYELSTVTDVTNGSFTPTPPSCPAATVENSNQTYVETVASGGVLTLPNTTYNITVDGAAQPPLTLPTLENNTINIIWI